ncbi:NADH-quinone oxidoreductase subunit C [Pantoea ananatis]
MLYDLHGMDERLLPTRAGLPAADFSVFYHLLSIERNRDIMLKVALSENDMHVPTIPIFSPMPTGMSAKPGRCLVSPLMVTRI